MLFRKEWVYSGLDRTQEELKKTRENVTLHKRRILDMWMRVCFFHSRGIKEDGKDMHSHQLDDQGGEHADGHGSVGTKEMD